MANPADFLALFGEDEGAAQAQAQALAEAMGRRRAAGTVASIIGGPFARAGQAFLGDAGQTQQALGQAGMFQVKRGMDQRKLLADMAGQRQAAADRDRGFKLREDDLAVRRGETAALRAAAGRDKEDKKTAADTKRADDIFIASDFEPSPEARPVETALKTDLFKKAANGSTMIKNTRTLREMVSKHGGGAFLGPKASEMRALATDLIMAGKEIYGLGVLNPNDEVILGRIIADPTKIESIASDQAGARSLDAIFGALEGVMRMRVNDAFAQAGHKPRKGSVFDRTGASLSPEDTEAKAWAEANPTDARAAEILKRLGAK